MECIITLLRWVSVLGGEICKHSHQFTHTHTQFSQPAISVFDWSVKWCSRLYVFKIIMLSSTINWHFFPYRCVWVSTNALSLSFSLSPSQDKQGIPWWLGLSYKGIFQYDYQDKVKPRKVSPSKICIFPPRTSYSLTLMFFSLNSSSSLSSSNGFVSLVVICCAFLKLASLQVTHTWG